MLDPYAGHVYIIVLLYNYGCSSGIDFVEPLKIGLSHGCFESRVVQVMQGCSSHGWFESRMSRVDLE